MTLIKTSDLGRLDVVSTDEGRYLGSVCDVDLDPNTGRINAVIVDQLRPFAFFRRRQTELEIQWRDIVLVGVDVVLVKNRTWKR